MRVHLLSSNINSISNDILNLTQHEVREVKLLSSPNGEEKPLLQAGQRLPVAPTREDYLPQPFVELAPRIAIGLVCIESHQRTAALRANVSAGL